MEMRRITAISLVCLICGTLSVFVGCGGQKDTTIPKDGERSCLGFDGNCFWIFRILGKLRSLSDIDKLKPQLVKLNRSGKIINTFDVNETVSGLAFDGENLWAVCETLESEVFYTIEPEAGELVTQFAVPSMGYDTEGLAAGSDKLWLFVSEEKGRCIYEIDIASRSVGNRIELPYLTPGGITYADGTLWVGDAGSRGEVLRIDPESGEIVRKYDLAHGYIFGLTTNGRDIFIGEADKNIIFALKK